MHLLQQVLQLFTVQLFSSVTFSGFYSHETILLIIKTHVKIVSLLLISGSWISILQTVTLQCDS